MKNIKAKAIINDVEYDAFGGSKNRQAAESPSEVRKSAKAVSSDWPKNKKMASPAMKNWLKMKGVKNVEDLNLTAHRAYLVRKLMDMGVKSSTALSYGLKQALVVIQNMEERAVV